MNIAANATANAYTTAIANANVGWGINQIVFAEGGTGVVGKASATVYNSADANLTIGASAHANGADASANASVGEGFLQAGIEQFAIGSSANAHVTNHGTLGISAVAYATGTSFADAHAGARGINQVAIAGNGNATAAVNNSGMLNIHASALASATAGGASAHAYVSGIQQYASGNSGTASVNNALGGTIDIGAVAKATGTQAGFEAPANIGSTFAF
jgi:hypothetical protein